METTGEKSSTAPKARPPIRTPFFYGWLLVGISGLGIFFSGPGQTYSNAVFIESYVRELSMDRTSISSIYSAATLASGLLFFIMGRLVDRYGRRVMFTTAALLLGVACWFNSMVTGPIMLFIGFFLVRYFGQGSLTLIPNTLVSQWFGRYRGRAISFAGLGGLLGAASFPPIMNRLIDVYGWRHTWQILGVLLILFLVPLVYYLVRNRPEDVNLYLDGIPIKAGGQDGKQSVVEDSWTLSEVVRTRSFWFILSCAAIPAALYTGITFQIYSILGERGVNRTTTSFVLSLIPLVSFGCSLIAGFVVERVKVARMLSLTFVLNIAAPLTLMTSHSYAAVLIFAVFWGVGQGALNVPMGVIWANYYGREHLGSIQSVTTTAMVVGSALGPIPFGWSYDHFGGYNFVLILSAAIWLIGAFLAFLAVPPRRKASEG
ncbi:MFS transporter [Paenibacillus agaridevorans]|uniref:MFS transporter n=1 Tax=Paenibacillus agaridevorans TaxID=171404 RepID=UPI001BE3F706|nr:MFS transporter [Paenibacillus agaridevorans]